MNVEELIKNEKGSTVDVRTVIEFEMGNVEGSLNIPMGEVSTRLEEFKSLAKPLILVCESGNRSGQVTQYLQSRGVEEVYNGGGWQEVVTIRKSKTN